MSHFGAPGGRLSRSTTFLHVRPVHLMRHIAIRYPVTEPMIVGLYRLRTFGWSVTALLRRIGRPPGDVEQMKLNALQAELLSTLSREGIAVTSVDALVGVGTAARLLAAADATLRDPVVQAQIDSGKGETGNKEFVVRAFGEPPLVPSNDPFLAMLLSERVLPLVNGYLPGETKLQSVNLWYSLPVNSGSPATSSQCWHRDYDDRTILKVFLYLVDVNSDMGPLEYMRESQPGGRYAKHFPQRPPFGATPPAGSVEGAIPAEQHFVGTGPAGTIVLCDTTGLHRGGRTTSYPRIVYYGAFTTNAAIEKPLLRLVGRFPEQLSARALRAVGGIRTKP